MGLEAATYINQLVSTNPVGAVDPKSQGDDHLRLIKSVLQNTFPNLSAAVTFTAANLNGQYPNGTSLAPAYTFAADTDTGLYRAAENDLRIVLGGALTVAFQTGGTIFKQALNVQDGAAATPSYTFENDGNSGVYRVGADDVGISAGGSRAFHVTAAQAYFLNGAVNAPSIAFDSDPDTGFYRFGADQIGIVVAGTLIGYVSATGFLNNTGQMQAQAGSVSAPGFAIDGDLNTGLYRLAADDIGLSAGGVNKFAASSTRTAIDTPLLRATGIHNGTAPTGATDQYIASGTYTPTITNVLNIASSSNAAAIWIRVGNVVIVSGTVTVDPTAAAARTVIELSLPIASNLAALRDLAGTHSTLVVGGTPSPASDSGVIIPQITNNTAQFEWIAGLPESASRQFHFMYLVL